MASPSKPLLTVRFSLLSSVYFTPGEIQGIFGPDLTRAGFKLYQTPAVKQYTPPFTVSTFSLFTSATDPSSPLFVPNAPMSEADPSRAPVYEFLKFKTPDGKPYSLLRQFADIAESDTQSFAPKDRYGTRPIVEKRTPRITTIAWNIGAKDYSPATQKALADLIWSIRKSRVHDPDKYTGLGWPALVAPWANTPAKLANYPERPALPAALVPPEPKPVPPKPVPPKPVPPKPVPPPLPPPPPPPPVPEESFFSKYGKWLLLAGFGIVLSSGKKK